MTDRQFQIEFERRLQLMDPELVRTNKLNSNTIFSFINEAIDKFYKTRYSGINSKSEGFEQSQKRIDDLRNLVASFKYTTEIVEEDSVFKVELPEDYVLLLGDTAGIVPLDEYSNCWKFDDNGDYVIAKSDTIEATIETLDRQLNNSLSEHLLKYNTAKPLRLLHGNQIWLFTDGKYRIQEYTITYLRKPEYLNSENITNTEYTSLPEHTHMEIVKIAVQLYLATKPMEHYSVYSAEVNNME